MSRDWLVMVGHMEFAKQELAKYGWTEGKGLGRDETGILKALKPLLKFDKAGMGHDAAETFTNHWWEKAFNAAADNITVNKYVDGSVTVDAENDFKIDDHKGISKKKKHLVYNNFVKTATLTNEGAMAEESQEGEEIPVIMKVPPLTDEELFRACGGRTAHKGARHGLGLNGKLARIEQQERLLLNLIEEVPENVPSSKRKKSKKSKVSDNLDLHISELKENESKNIETMADIPSENIDDENVRNVIKVKRSKKSKRAEHRIEEIMPNEEQIENNLKQNGTGHKKPKKTINVEIKVDENVGESDIKAEEISRKKSKKARKKKKKSTKDTTDENIGENKKEKKSKISGETVNEEEVEVEKQRKKSKKSIIADREEAMVETVSEVINKKEKRKKRKCAADSAIDSTACMAEDTGNDESTVPKKKKKSNRKKNAE